MAAGYARGAKKDAAAEDLITAISRQGLLPEGARVLDVGCGPGHTAIAFARHGAEVTALDFSAAMLDRLRVTLRSDIAGRVHPVEANWEEVDLANRGWEQAFDLTLACMTPAIRTPENFLKLHRASRGGCYFRGWADRRRDPVLEALWLHLTGKPAPSLVGMTGGVLVAFNLLYAMGCSPSVEFQEVSWERHEPVDKAVGFFTDYFDGISDLPAPRREEKIREYLESVAEAGRVRRRTTGRTGSITWKVPQP